MRHPTQYSFTEYSPLPFLLPNIHNPRGSSSPCQPCLFPSRYEVRAYWQCYIELGLFKAVFSDNYSTYEPCCCVAFELMVKRAGNYSIYYHAVKIIGYRRQYWTWSSLSEYQLEFPVIPTGPFGVAVVRVGLSGLGIGSFVRIILLFASHVYFSQCSRRTRKACFSLVAPGL